MQRRKSSGQAGCVMGISTDFQHSAAKLQGILFVSQPACSPYTCTPVHVLMSTHLLVFKVKWHVVLHIYAHTLSNWPGPVLQGIKVWYAFTLGFVIPCFSSITRIQLYSHPQQENSSIAMLFLYFWKRWACWWTTQFIRLFAVLSLMSITHSFALKRWYSVLKFRLLRQSVQFPNDAGNPRLIHTHFSTQYIIVHHRKEQTLI